MTQDAERLRLTIKEFMADHNLKVAPWSRRAEISEGTLRNFLSGTSDSLTYKSLKRLADAAGVSVATLLGEAPPFQFSPIPAASQAGVPGLTEPTPNNSDVPSMVDDRQVFVRQYSAEASAGSGTIIDDDQITGYLAFRSDWLKTVTVASPDDLSVIAVTGDSMEPFLMSGDTVLVDSTQREPRHDGIYVIRHDDVVQVKRLTTDPTTGLITISSDNPAYASFNDKSPTDIDIFGRVIWLGRKV